MLSEKKKIYQNDYYIANDVIILVGDDGLTDELIWMLPKTKDLNHKVVINDIFATVMYEVANGFYL